MFNQLKSLGWIWWWIMIVNLGFLSLTGDFYHTHIFIWFSLSFSWGLWMKWGNNFNLSSMTHQIKRKIIIFLFTYKAQTALSKFSLIQIYGLSNSVGFYSDKKHKLRRKVSAVFYWRNVFRIKIRRSNLYKSIYTAALSLHQCT